MNPYRCRPHAVVLSLTAAALLFHAPAGAQTADTGAMPSLAALLDETDAVVHGFVSAPAPSNQPGEQHPVVVYNLRYPVVVFDGGAGLLGLDARPSWLQTVEVRVDNRDLGADREHRTLVPGEEALLFVQKRDNVLVVAAAVRIEDDRVVPHLPDASFARAYAGMKMYDFTEEVVLRRLFLPPHLRASSN